MAIALLAMLACTGDPEDPVVTLDLGLLPVVDDPAAGACVSVQLDRWDADHRARQLDELAALGAREIRQDLRWDYVQPARDLYDWTTEDAVVNAAHGAGIEVIAMVGYGVPWATSQPGAGHFTPPDDPLDFATFAGAVAARYGDRIDRYEIWNEPNAGFRFWQVGDPPRLAGDPVGYANLFVPAADAIHAADPGAEVQVGSVFFHGQGIPSGPEFLAAAVAARPDLLDAADAVSFHPYTQYPPRAAPEAADGGEIPVTEMVTAIEEAAPGLPVAVTEFGWPVWDPLTAQDQADFVLREVALLHASGVRDTCVYTLEDHPGEVGNPEDAFGLYDAQGVAKPVVDAWRGVFDALAGTDVAALGQGDAAERLGWPASARAVRYVVGGDAPAALTIAWSVDGDVDVELPNVQGAAEPPSLTLSASPQVWVQRLPAPAD